MTQCVDMTCGHAMKLDANKVAGGFHPQTRNHAVIAAPNHHVHRRIGRLDIRLHREFTRTADRLASSHFRCRRCDVLRSDQIERARLVVGTPATPILDRLKHRPQFIVAVPLVPHTKLCHTVVRPASARRIAMSTQGARARRPGSCREECRR